MYSNHVHVAITRRNAAIAHDNRHLVQRFGQRGPEIPVIDSAAQIGARIAFHGVVEVGEFERVAQEEHRRVVADHVPIAFFGVELNGKTANVALSVSRAALAGNGREAGKQIRFLADLREDFRLRITRNVVGYGKAAVGAATLGMHAALRDHLAVEVRELLEEPHILQQLRAAWASRHHILVMGDRATGVRG